MQPKTLPAFELLATSLDHDFRESTDLYVAYLINTLQLELMHSCRGYHTYTEQEKRNLLRGYAMLDNEMSDVFYLACLTVAKTMDFYPCNLFGQIYNDHSGDNVCGSMLKRDSTSVKIAILSFDNNKNSDEVFNKEFQAFCANDTLIKIAA